MNQFFNQLYHLWSNFCSLRNQLLIYYIIPFSVSLLKANTSVFIIHSQELRRRGQKLTFNMKLSDNFFVFPFFAHCFLFIYFYEAFEICINNKQPSVHMDIEHEHRPDTTMAVLSTHKTPTENSPTHHCQ